MKVSVENKNKIIKSETVRDKIVNYIVTLQLSHSDEIFDILSLKLIEKYNSGENDVDLFLNNGQWNRGFGLKEQPSQLLLPIIV